jgi:hypothetical protein
VGRSAIATQNRGSVKASSDAIVETPSGTGRR